MEPSKLKAILKDHKLWFRSGGKQGKRANLRGAHLERANLQGAILLDANLQGANLQGANLQGAKFTTNFKKVDWFNYATFSEDQIPWVVLHPKYPVWVGTLKWVKAKQLSA